MIPEKWGQGQLFAFSALDGESFFTDDFTGHLTGDRLGVIFETSTRRTLYSGDINKFLSPKISCVASDIIEVTTQTGNFSIIFAERHLIIGEFIQDSGVFVSLNGNCKINYKDDIEIHNTEDGEYTALLKKNGRFAFCYGKNEESVINLCNKGLSIDISELKKEKLSYYKNNEKKEYSSLYSKCLSVMKSQLYSPEGNIKRIWSTPDRLPHRNMWLWDSVFHAIGHRHIDTSISQDLILALFDVQQENGFIPHMSRPDYISSITQPPVIAWGAWLVYEKSKDKEFLKTVSDKNKLFLLWCQNNRRHTEKELYSWHTNPELNNRCDESGMDNSPRFDTTSNLYAIDFSCYMANETRIMKKIADELGDKKNSEFFNKWHLKIKDDINNILWCEEDGYFYDYDIDNNCFNKIKSVASFLPVFSQVCNKYTCDQLIKHLENPDEFGTDFPIPSISKKDKSFGSDMWRGPVWINYNYMISEGLSAYGFDKLAAKIRNTTISVISEWYQRTGTVFEFYDSENKIPPSCFNRKGEVYEPYDFRVKYQSIRDYGWSITLTFDLINTQE